MRRFGIRQRFILLLFSLFVVLFGAIAVIQVLRTASTERANLNEQSKSFATLATKPIGDAFLLYKDSGKIRITQQVNKFTDLNPDVAGVGIVDTTGRLLFKSGDVGSISAKQASQFEPVYSYNNGIIHQVVTPLIEDFGVHRYAIIYNISDQRLIVNIQRTIALIVLLSIMTFAVAIMLTYWLINRLFLSAVSTISEKALRISKGNLEDQIELKRNDELGDLASAVNTMANSLKADIAKLQETDRLKTEFITISSHNLRTPLTTIKGNVEILDAMEVPDNLKEFISSISSNANRLDGFVEDLLAISTIESGKLNLYDITPQPIKPLLDSISKDYKEVAQQKQLEFECVLDLNDERVVMSKPSLKNAIENLLENAFKFTEKGKVTLKAVLEGNSILITVSDTGIGISKDELPKLFTKFHRATGIMEYNYEGTGIGLYLTKLIVEEHAGSISVDSEEGRGTTFSIRLPLAPKDSK